MAVKKTRAAGWSMLLLGLITSGVAIVGVDAPASAAAQIPDAGLPAVIIEADAMVSQRTERLAAGVVGVNKNNDSFPQLDTPVLAFAEHDGIMYVGGKFTNVEIAATGERYDQPFLAAFDRESGRWISSFRPVVDGNVWDLKATADGYLIIAGQFRSVDGAPNTAGIARIDLNTGLVTPNWSVNLERSGSRWALGRTLDIEGGDLYIGGDFSKITGTNGVLAHASNMARVDLATGNADPGFLPHIDGIVFDVDAVGDKVYIAGNYYYTNGEWTLGQSSVRTSDGANYPGQKAPVRTDARVQYNYQQAIMAVGSDVWMTGSQHSTHVYRASDYEFLRGWLSSPYGDGQALALLNGIVYKGSHANASTYEYADTTDFQTYTGWTSRQRVKWVGAWDATNGSDHDHLDWYPQIGTNTGEGGWELFADSVECLWAGGDFARGSYDGDVPRYVGGFARFCSKDDVAPNSPSDLVARDKNDGVNLSWNGSTDDRRGTVRYEILKNDSLFASYVGITTFRDPDGTPNDRYFVRAIDYTGNRSETTPVATAAVDTQAPSAPSRVTASDTGAGAATLTWRASTDDSGVERYVVYNGDMRVAQVTEPRAVVRFQSAREASLTVVALDAAGNQSAPSAPVSVVITGDPGANSLAPSTPTNVRAKTNAAGGIDVSWNASTDDGTVAEYIVTAGGAEVGRTSATSLTVATPPDRVGRYQVIAVDDLDNRSAASAGYDVQPPIYNIALNKSFDATPAFRGRDYAQPKFAFDGRTKALTADAGLYISGMQTNPWIEVDLGQVSQLSHVNLFNRTDGWSDRLTDVYVFVSSSPMTGRSFDSLVQDADVYQVRYPGTVGTSIALDTPTSGRHVRVQLGGRDYLQLVEVEVYGRGESESIAPTTPTGFAGQVEDNGDLTLTWEASTDNVAVAEYAVYKNGVELQRVSGLSATVTDPSVGWRWYQVLAIDTTGNVSALTEVADVKTPKPPTDLDATIEANGDVALTWTAATDNVGVAEYIIYRNGVEIGRSTAPSHVVTAPVPGSHWYQVRAVDAAGNQGRQTPATRVDIQGDDTRAPTTPRDLDATIDDSGDVTLTWAAAIDDVGVTEYVVTRNGVEIGRSTVLSHVVTAPAVGSHWYQVRAVDAAGNESRKTPSARVDIVGADVKAPTTPSGLDATIDDSGDVTLTWVAATDDVGVTEYVVTRNGVEIGRSATLSFVVDAPAAGSHWYQVRAVDAAGNESRKTPSARVDIVGADVKAPTTPSGLDATIDDSGDVTLTWVAATDDVGVTEYVVTRNGVEIGRSATLSFVVDAPAAGSHWYQVRAVDAAGNESRKTPSTRVDI